MDEVLGSNQFDETQIRQINYCRLHLQVLTISDIAKPNGCDLDLSMHKGFPSLESSRTTLHHFNQERPNKTAWAQWRKANLLWSNGKYLNKPLGPWLASAPDLRRDWPAYYDAQWNSVYIRTAEKYDGYSLTLDTFETAFLISTET